MATDLKWGNKVIMSKIANAIKMLNYLNTGNKYTVKELSEKIGITPRMIRYYKTELEELGIPIETFMGPNGGYYIINSQKQFNHFNKYDIELLEGIFAKLKKDNYKEINKLKQVIDKIKFSFDIEEEKSKYFLTEGNSDKRLVNQKINEAIIKKESVKILYKSIKQEWQERTIHPIKTFSYDNKLYVTAFCELRNSIRHFEIDEIKII